MRKRRYAALMFAVAMLAGLWLETLRAGDPSIYLISRFGTNGILIHFDTEPFRTYELQFTSRLQCGTNSPGCSSNLWHTIYTVPNQRFPNHYIYPHYMTNTMGAYRLRVRP